MARYLGGPILWVWHAALTRAAAVTWRDAAASGWALQLEACPFGDTGATTRSLLALSAGSRGTVAGCVYNWERVGHALRTIMCRLFHLPMARYVDDMFNAPVVRLRRETSAARFAAAQSGIARAVLQDLLGWQLDDGKRAAVRGRSPRRRRGGPRAFMSRREHPP
jgi:hypothetical protein